MRDVDILRFRRGITVNGPMMRSAALAVAVVAAMGALSMPQVGTAAGSRANRGAGGPPHQLWQRFPLKEKTPATSPRPKNPTARATTTPTGNQATRGVSVPARPADRSDRAWISLWLVIAGALGLSAAAAVVAVLITTVRHGGDPMNRFRAIRHRDRSVEQADEPQEDSLPEQTMDAGARVAQYLGSAEDTAAATDESPSAGGSSDRLGDHVSAIVSAAEEAALRIQEEARQEAERIRDEARKEAADHVEAAREEAEASTANAERIRSEADEWASHTRETAENYAADRRAEADAEARKIIATAEDRVAASNKEAERRRQELKMDISLAEDRLRQLSAGLHELAARLDKLLSMPPAAADAGEVVDDENGLIDELEPSREVEEAATK
jgi:hypothetical protein